MTSAETLLSDPPQPSVALCAILSVVIHVGLLAVLGYMPDPTPTNESVPVIQISLVPVQSQKPSVSPPQSPPSLRAVSRPASPPLLSSPLPPQVMTSRMKSVDSTLEPPVTQPAQEPPPKSSNKKVVKDQQAADALVGRTLMKLSNSRSSPSQAHSSPQPSSPASQLMTSPLRSVESTLEPPVTQPAQEPPRHSSKKKGRKRSTDRGCISRADLDENGKLSEHPFSNPFVISDFLTRFPSRNSWPEDLEPDAKVFVYSTHSRITPRFKG